MMDMERRYRQMRRATVAHSVFDWVALVCLGSSIVFWMTLHWAWLSPPSLISMQSIVAIVMGLIYSLVTPLLWSAMAPSTPAGMMLQRTQTRTWGFVVMIAACGFLTWHGWRLIGSWWMAQRTIADTGEALPLAISCLIGFVAIPALAWTATTPEKWMAAVEQAHQVKKLEMQQRSELAIIKASLVRAETLAAIGWANLLPAEKDEVVKTLQGLLMGSADSMRAVVRTLNLSSDLERSIMNDNDIADHLDYVTSRIDIVPEVAPAARESTAAIVDVQPVTSPVASSAHVDSRPVSSESRGAQSVQARPGRTQSDMVHDAIARDLPPVFTAADVSDRMQWTDKREGQRVIRAWLDEGTAKEVRLGRYSLTEREARS